MEKAMMKRVTCRIFYREILGIMISHAARDGWKAGEDGF